METIGWAGPSPPLCARRWRGLIREFSIVGLAWRILQSLPPCKGAERIERREFVESPKSVAELLKLKAVS